MKERKGFSYFMNGRQQDGESSKELCRQANGKMEEQYRLETNMSYEKEEKN